MISRHSRYTCCLLLSFVLLVSIVSAFSPIAGIPRKVSPPLQALPQEGDVFESPTLVYGMKYAKLGSSDLVVSKICLGTMTWGEQNTEAEAAEQLNVAVDTYGINFIDTAEMYPVPGKAETQGATDRAIGKWLKNRRREDIVLASKVSGRSTMNAHIRSWGEGTRVRKKDIIESVDKSLQRLGTDYLDLLQVHWPERYVPLFGSPTYDPAKETSDAISFEEQLEALDVVVKAGKVRHIGLSNETPYGVGKFCELSERMDLPRPISVQNCYNLINRVDTEMSGLVEVCAPVHHNVGLLAYSPLAGGVLSGKYELENVDTSKSRLNLFKGFMARYRDGPSRIAVEEYCQVARENGLDPGQLAIAWVHSRHFVTSTIIGATSMHQLRENIESINCPITEKAEDRIKEVHQLFMDSTRIRAPPAAVKA